LKAKPARGTAKRGEPCPIKWAISPESDQVGGGGLG